MNAAQGSPVVRVLVSRPVESAEPLVVALEAAGLGVAAVPAMAIHPVEGLGEDLSGLGPRDWLVVTSPAGARVVGDHLASVHGATTPRMAVIGGATASAVRARGAAVDVVSREATPEGLVAALRSWGPLAGCRVVLARSELADAALPLALRDAGADVRSVVAYRVELGPPASLGPMRMALTDPDLRVHVVASGSAVTGSLALARALDREDRVASQPSAGWESRLRGLVTITIGPSTAAAARRAMLAVVAVSPRPDVGSVVRTALRVTTEGPVARRSRAMPS